MIMKINNINEMNGSMNALIYEVNVNAFLKKKKNACERARFFGYERERISI